MVIVNEDGSIGHSEMRFGDGLIMVGREFDEHHKSPVSLGGVNTNTVHIQLEGGLDAHCERARAAGAVITREPADQFYGDRSYMAMDPEGHYWSFAQTFKVMSNEELDRTLAALAEPYQRRVVDVLSRGPRAAGELAREVGLAAPAMSRRLRALRQAGLIEESHPEFDARVRIYALRSGAMSDLKRWLEEIEAMWALQLAALKAHLEKARGP